jgi:5'-nucleotidase
VIAALENGVSQWEQGAGRFLSGVAGLRYTFDLAKPAGSRVSKVEVLKDGQYVPIDPAATYRAVVNNFIAAGGDGFDSLKNAKGARYDTGFSDAEAFLEYVRHLGTVDAKEEGRITILNEPKASLEPAPYQPDRFALA